MKQTLSLALTMMTGCTQAYDLEYLVMLQNLLNEVDVANVDGTANFNGNAGGAGNHVAVLNGKKGSELNFSQLLNLDSDIGTFDSYDEVNFVGGGGGMNTIGDFRGNPGSTTNFSQLQNLNELQQLITQKELDDLIYDIYDD